MPHHRLWKPGPQTHVLRTEHAHAATSQGSLKQSAPEAAAHSVDTAQDSRGQPQPSMPTAQLLGDHDSKARQRLRRSPWTRADCSIACFFLNWPRWRLEDAGHNTPPPLQWSAARRVHNTLPPSQYYAPTLVAWKRSIDRLPRQSNAAESAMHPDSSGRRV